MRVRQAQLRIVGTGSQPGFCHAANFARSRPVAGLGPALNGADVLQRYGYLFYRLRLSYAIDAAALALLIVCVPVRRRSERLAVPAIILRSTFWIAAAAWIYLWSLAV